MQVDFTKCAAQTNAYRAFRPGNRVANAWGRGVGKSWFARVLMWLLVAEWEGRIRTNALLGKSYRGVRVALVMPTLAQFKRIGHAQAILDDLSPSGDWAMLGAEINRSDWCITFPGGSTIQVVSADNINNNRGLRRDVVVVDEADDVDISAFESVIGPWFTEPVSLRQILVTGTPRRGRYGLLWKAFRVWPKGDAEHRPISNAFGFHTTGYDCPAIVSREWLDSERRNVSKDRFDREYLCNFDSGEGLVYPMFDADFHVREPDYGYPWTEILVGVDHGWNDPGVFLVAGVIGNGRDATIHCIEEVYQTAQDTTWWCDKAVDVAGRYARYRQRWYVDPSRPDRIQDLKKAVRKAHPQLGDRFSMDEAINEIEAGVDALADRISVRERESGDRQARFYVSPSCENTISEFGQYRRKKDPRNEDRVLDDIVDKDNHSMDCARYLTMTRFGGPDRRRHELGPRPRASAEPT